MYQAYLFHGLGSSKNSFHDLGVLLKDHCHIIPLGFAGFGARIAEEIKPDPITRCIKEIYEKTRDQNNLVFIAHSMGSAVALPLSKLLGNRVKSIINIEGNLISEDCGLLSRRIAKENEQTLSEIMGTLRNDLISSRYRGHREWCEDIRNVSPGTLKSYSEELVRRSDSNDLLDCFLNFSGGKLYLYGDEYTKHPVLKKLKDIDSIYIENSGHFVMTDQPEKCYETIRTHLSVSTLP